ncbi:MAG: [acyl-carrier-protein] S-malonyltransferase [Verrucomicrobiales bacterium]|jgi:[acyl-carrier-protein] S-malonyltransferase
MSVPSIVLLFAGQGSQAVGMGRTLAERFSSAKALLDQADSILDFSLSAVMFDGPEEELTRTSRCQPALYVHGMMCLAALREQLGKELQIGAVAGLSLGEFTAHAAAGTFGFVEGLQLVAKRGRFMEEACEATDGSMAAMIGGTVEQVRELANSVGVDVANLNSPGQVVVSGARDRIAAAIAGAKEAGIRIAKEIKVAGAYHSALMLSAQDKLAAELSQISINTPNFPVLSNLTAEPAMDAEEIRRTLEAQVTGSVRWSESIEKLLEDGQSHFLEGGPGKVLTGLMGRIRKGTFCMPTGEAEALNDAIVALKAI